MCLSFVERKSQTVPVIVQDVHVWWLTPRMTPSRVCTYMEVKGLMITVKASLCVLYLKPQESIALANTTLPWSGLKYRCESSVSSRPELQSYTCSPLSASGRSSWTCASFTARSSSTVLVNRVPVTAFTCTTHTSLNHNTISQTIKSTSLFNKQKNSTVCITTATHQLKWTTMQWGITSCTFLLQIQCKFILKNAIPVDCFLL